MQIRRVERGYCPGADLQSYEIINWAAWKDKLAPKILIRPVEKANKKYGTIRVAVDADNTLCGNPEEVMDEMSTKIIKSEMLFFGRVVSYKYKGISFCGGNSVIATYITDDNDFEKYYVKPLREQPPWYIDKIYSKEASFRATQLLANNHEYYLSDINMYYKDNTPREKTITNCGPKFLFNAIQNVWDDNGIEATQKSDKLNKFLISANNRQYAENYIVNKGFIIRCESFWLKNTKDVMPIFGKEYKFALLMQECQTIQKLQQTIVESIENEIKYFGKFNLSFHLLFVYRYTGLNALKNIVEFAKKACDALKEKIDTGKYPQVNVQKTIWLNELKEELEKKPTQAQDTLKQEYQRINLVMQNSAEIDQIITNFAKYLGCEEKNTVRSETSVLETARPGESLLSADNHTDLKKRKRGTIKNSNASRAFFQGSAENKENPKPTTNWQLQYYKNCCNPLDLCKCM